jgi:hypothetical protein
MLMEDNQAQSDHHSLKPLTFFWKKCLDQPALPLRDLARPVLLLPQILIPKLFSTSQPDPLSMMLMEDHQAQSDHHSQLLLTFFWSNNQDQPAIQPDAKPLLLLIQTLILEPFSTSQPDPLLTTLMEDNQAQLDHHTLKPLTFFWKKCLDQPAIQPDAKPLLLLIQTLILEPFSTSQPDLLSTTLMEDNQAQSDHHTHKPLMFN